MQYQTTSEDYFFDGRSLSKLLEIELPWWMLSQEGDAMSTVNKSQQLPLFLCHCGAKDCGYFVCRAALRDDAIVWDQFAFDDQFDGFSSRTFPSIPAMRFRKEEYEHQVGEYLKRRELRIRAAERD